MESEQRVREQTESELRQQYVREEEFEEFHRNLRRNTAENVPEGRSDALMKTVEALIAQNNQLLSLLQISRQPTTTETATIDNSAATVQNGNGAIKNFHIMPDLSKSIDKFNGEKGPLSAKLWLQQVETTASLHEWPEPFIFQTAKTHLEGAAKFWFVSKSEEITDWNAFKTAFKKTFTFEASKTDLWRNMTERVQLPRENVALTTTRKLRCVNNCS